MTITISSGLAPVIKQGAGFSAISRQSGMAVSVHSVLVRKKATALGYDSMAIWRSFVDAPMMPPVSVCKRSVGRGPNKKSRRALRCGRRSVSVGTKSRSQPHTNRSCRQRRAPKKNPA